MRLLINNPIILSLWMSFFPVSTMQATTEDTICQMICTSKKVIKALQNFVEEVGSI